MKSIKFIANLLRRPLVMVLLGLAFVTSAAEAARIEYYVYARGYWAQIVPGSNTGGRVIYSPAHCGFITDRASRGEEIVAYVSRSTSAEVCNPAINNLFLSSRAGTKSLRGRATHMNAAVIFETPVNANWDDVRLNVDTVSGRFSKRIPIGTRP